MKRRHTRLLFALLLGLALTCVSLAQQEWPKTPPQPAGDPGDAFAFAVCGDNRPAKPTDPQPRVYLDVIRRINDTAAAFVVNTGDIILGTKDLDLMGRQLDDFVQATDALKAPCYVAYGNHEQRDEPTLEVLEQRIGPRYFAFDYGNSRFYILNTEMDGEEGQIAGEQLAWLREDLAARGAAMAHRFAFFHRPMFSPMNDIGKRHWGDPGNLKLLQSLFGDNQVDAVFNGHDHYSAWRVVDGVMHVLTGGAGAPLYQAPGALSIHHFILVKVDGDRLSINLVPVEETEGPAPDVTDAAAQIVLARGSKGWRYTDRFPTAAPPDRDGKQWYEVGYDTSDWAEASLPLGYKRGGEMQFATEVAINGGDYYIIGSFAAPQGLEAKTLTLRINSDNGAVVYVNGQLVDDDPAASEPPGHNPEYWNRVVTIEPGIVRAGDNHVAIRLANNQGSSDAFLDLEIVIP